jgi:hypothetical protein
MAYTKPNTFADGTTLLSSEVQGNVDALRVYLHNNVVQADLLNSQWVDTRHIQPPRYSAVEGLQHGVTGYQGGQWSGSLVRLTFATSYLTGAGRDSSAGDWRRVPGTSFRLDIRRDAKVLFHWQIEVEAGPDDIPQVSGRTPSIASRHAFFAPYYGVLGAGGRNNYDAQEVTNNQDGFRSTSPYGPDEPYTVCNGYGQRSGVLLKELSAGVQSDIGLCAWSQIDRSAVINWSVALEVWYL